MHGFIDPRLDLGLSVMTQHLTFLSNNWKSDLDLDSSVNLFSAASLQTFLLYIDSLLSIESLSDIQQIHFIFSSPP